MKQYFHEQAVCPICDGKSRLIGMAASIDSDSSLKLELRECTDCHHWWHNPMPFQDYLSSLYMKASSLVVPAGYENEVQVEPKDILVGFNAWLCQAEKVVSEGGRCLEVGSGGGHFLKYLQSKGVLCDGIEPGKWAPQSSIYPDIDEVPHNNYDFFVLSDVLEHLENPIDMLKKLKNNASNDARCYCSFPNKDSIPAKIFKSHWKMVRPLGHLHYFSRKSATTLLEKSGWTIKEITAVNTVQLIGSTPKKTVSRIIQLPTYWKDQFWVRAECSG